MRDIHRLNCDDGVCVLLQAVKPAVEVTKHTNVLIFVRFTTDYIHTYTFLS